MRKSPLSSERHSERRLRTVEAETTASRSTICCYITCCPRWHCLAEILRNTAIIPCFTTMRLRHIGENALRRPLRKAKKATEMFGDLYRRNSPNSFHMTSYVIQQLGAVLALPKFRHPFCRKAPNCQYRRKVMMKTCYFPN